MAYKSNDPRLIKLCKQAKKTRQSQLNQGRSAVPIRYYEYYTNIMQEWNVSDKYNKVKKILYPSKKVTKP